MSNESEQKILDTISELRNEVNNQGERLTRIERDVERLTVYQQANQNLINLAFGLIASATIVTVAVLLFNR